MKTHRCKLPNSTTYRAGVVFTCSSCGKTYVLTVAWVEKPNLRQVPEKKDSAKDVVTPKGAVAERVFRSMEEVDAAFFPNIAKDDEQRQRARRRRRVSNEPSP